MFTQKQNAFLSLRKKSNVSKRGADAVHLKVIAG